jgi:hypothetical protein
MKRVLFATLLIASMMVISGCKKSTEEQLQDAAKSAEKDAAAAQKDLGNKLDDALGK